MRTFWLLFGISLSLFVTVAYGCRGAQDAGEHLRTVRAESQASTNQERQIAFLNAYTEALAEARQSGKPLLVFFSTEECIYCHQMLEKTFQDQQVVELSEKFICVQIEASEAPEICKDFHIQAFPTVQFITADGIPLHRVLGRKEPEVLVAQMEAALQDPHSRTAYWAAGGLQR